MGLFKGLQISAGQMRSVLQDLKFALGVFLSGLHFFLSLIKV